MFFLSIPTTIYPIVTLFLLATWPLVFIEDTPIFLVAAATNAVSMVLVWNRCSSPDLSFRDGLNDIAAATSSGIYAFTIVYSPFLLALTYLFALGFTVEGYLTRSDIAAVRWHRVVYWFVRHSWRKNMEPPPRHLEDAVAMMEAAHAGDVKALGRLLDRGAYVDTRIWNDRTALFFAAGTDRVEAIRLLLDRGADCEVRDEDGNTALDHARLKGRTKAVEALATAEQRA